MQYKMILKFSILISTAITKGKSNSIAVWSQQMPDVQPEGRSGPAVI